MLAPEEISFKGGVAGASSVYEAKRPARAFLSRGTPDSVLRNLALWTEGNPEPPPFFIWYEFETPIQYPIKLSFEHRVDSGFEQAPKSFQFVGTNDRNCSSF